jgi:hypothetical protein
LKAGSRRFSGFTGVLKLKTGAGLVLFVHDLPFAKSRGCDCPDRSNATGFEVAAVHGVTQKPTLLTNQTLRSKFFFHESAR